MIVVIFVVASCLFWWFAIGSLSKSVYVCVGCEDNARPKSPGGGGVESLRACAYPGRVAQKQREYYWCVVAWRKNSQLSIPQLPEFLPSPSNLLIWWVLLQVEAVSFQSAGEPSRMHITWYMTSMHILLLHKKLCTEMEKGVSCKIYHPFRHISRHICCLASCDSSIQWLLLHCDFRRASASDVMGFFRMRWLIIRIFSLPEQSFLSLLVLHIYNIPICCQMPSTREWERARPIIIYLMSSDLIDVSLLQACDDEGGRRREESGLFVARSGFVRGRP